MPKKLLFLAGNYYPELTGIGRYNTEMIDWLADNGFSCTVISTYPYYPHWKMQPPYRKKNWWFKKEKKTTPGNNTINVYRCPHYVPTNPTGKKRVLLDLSFLISATIKLIGLIGRKYDYIINITPPLSLGLVACFYKKISGALFLYHIQDLQVDAARDLKMISSMRLINTLTKIEKFVLNKADQISTISAGMEKKILSKTNKPVLLFPNWSDTHRFFPINERESLKKEFGFETNIPVILYSGSIGEKQGIENILLVAENFKKTFTKGIFIICGSGPYKELLEAKTEKLMLDNLIFKPLQPNEKLNAFLNMADIHLILQKSAAADLVMPSKLANILSVGGVAIITANEGSSLHSLIAAQKMGVLCTTEDVDALVISVKKVLSSDNSTIRLNARRYATNILSIDKIMPQYVKAALH